MDTALEQGVNIDTDSGVGRPLDRGRCLWEPTDRLDRIESLYQQHVAHVLECYVLVPMRTHAGNCKPRYVVGQFGLRNLLGGE